MTGLTARNLTDYFCTSSRSGLLRTAFSLIIDYIVVLTIILRRGFRSCFKANLVFGVLPNAVTFRGGNAVNGERSFRFTLDNSLGYADRASSMRSLLLARCPE